VRHQETLKRGEGVGWPAPMEDFLKALRNVDWEPREISVDWYIIMTKRYYQSMSGAIYIEIRIKMDI
jgi:hypothetical protein